MSDPTKDIGARDDFGMNASEIRYFMKDEVVSLRAEVDRLTKELDEWKELYNRSIRSADKFSEQAKSAIELCKSI